MTLETQLFRGLAQIYQTAFHVLKVQAVDPMPGLALRVLPTHAAG
jgi:hypothetical protein